MLSSMEKICAYHAPRHIAIIMDGNGRWAQMRGKDRVYGHSNGARALTKVIKRAIFHQIEILTVFAFSSENWNRPDGEVNALMHLFAKCLRSELRNLYENKIKVNFIGDLGRFNSILQKHMRKVMEITGSNHRIVLNVAVNYGGRWDVLNACRSLCSKVQTGELSVEQIGDDMFKDQLSIVDDVDLIIRTGGEKRISNFLLYQMAYAEIYFTDLLWPDFNEEAIDEAIGFYRGRERRFGLISEQLGK